MRPVKPIVGIVLVFLLGAVSGSLVTYLMSQSRIESFMKGGPGLREGHLIKRLTKELDLDALQQQQVAAVIRETHRYIRQIRQKSRPQIEAVLEGSQQRISSLLRPEQQVKFKKVVAEHKARRDTEEH